MPDLRPTHRSLLNQPTPPFEGASAAIWPSHPRYGKRGPERAVGNRGRTRGRAAVNRRPCRRCARKSPEPDTPPAPRSAQCHAGDDEGHLAHQASRGYGQRSLERGRRSGGRAALDHRRFIGARDRCLANHLDLTRHQCRRTAFGRSFCLRFPESLKGASL